MTFPFYNVWLGLVAVFDTTDPSTIGTVHTRLSWAPAPLGPWQWLAPGGLAGTPFVLNGGPPIAPPPAPPAPPAPPGSACTAWAPVLGNSKEPLNDCAAYRGGDVVSHTICGEKNRRYVGEMNLEACRAACSALGLCKVVQWQGEKAHGYAADKAGQCYLVQDDCPASSQTQYDSGHLWKTFCMEIDSCIRHRQQPAETETMRAERRAADAPATQHGPVSAPFDSHIIFPAHTPFVDGGEVRVYYMGCNGKLHFNTLSWL